jgi:hypothetical protein
MHNKWKVHQATFYLRCSAFVCFLLVKFMSDAERKGLEEEDRLLKTLLDFHHKHKGNLSMTNDEREQHIDAILERIWQIKQHLKD